MDDIAYAGVSQLAEALRTGAVSARVATERQLQRIRDLDGGLRAYVVVLEDQALAEAEALDRERALGRIRGPLHGVPLGVKDLLDVAGAPTGAGAVLRRQNAAEDAAVVRRLRSAGAIIVGKLQLTEGAYSDHHPEIAAPVNPWDPEMWTGISSSGAAVAVAAGLCYGAIGSDTGGSIRWPCAATGLTGLKPTWGRVSRRGGFALAASLDHFGPMARSAPDAGLLYAAITGPDPHEPTALLEDVEALPEAASLRGLRIGLDPIWAYDDVDPAVERRLQAAVATLRDLGAEIVDISFPDVRQAIADWFVICATEAAVAHRETFPSREAEYGPVLAHVLRAGAAASALDLAAAHVRRLELSGRIEALLRRVDAALLPAQPFGPLTVADVQALGVRPDLVARLQRYTCAFNLSGHPTLSLPGGLDENGRPVGVQLVARRLGEATLLRIGAAFQAVTNHHRHRPGAITGGAAAPVAE